MRALCVLLVIGVSVVLAEDDTLSGAIEKCGSAQDLTTCLRVKTVSLLDRAMRSGPFVINDYLSLAPATEPNGTLKTEEQIEQELPKDEDKKDAALDDMIVEKVTSFVSSRSLRFQIPNQLQEEGRKKGYGGGKKGGGMMMMMAVAGMASWMIQMAFAKIALIAGKALLVGKMALLLSAVIGLKKLMSNDGGHEAPQVVYATESHGHGWGRSAQEMAYSAHAPAAQGH